MPWLKDSFFRLKMKENVEPVAFTARIADKRTLEKFDRIAIDAGYKRNELLNLVIEKFVHEAVVEEMDEKELNELNNKFDELSQILKLAVNKNIKIGLNEDELGRERRYFNLSDYEISFEDKSLKLKLEGEEDIFFRSFNEIYDIAYYENDLHFKVWIYMPDNNWRFYLIK